MKQKSYLIYGIHAVKAALENENRDCSQAFFTKEVADQLENSLKKNPRCAVQIQSRKEISDKLNADAVHQGCALKVFSLDGVYLEDLIQDETPNQLIMALDQVTDPHNVGAILRSCAAFGAKALILPERNAPPEESAVLAKIACGAVEHIPLITVPNLVRALETLKEKEYWCMGLDERGDKTMDQMDMRGKHVLVMGAEGEGLRRLTRESCDFLVQLPTTPSFPTLNVSNAAAISLYQFAISTKSS